MFKKEVNITDLLISSRLSKDKPSARRLIQMGNLFARENPGDELRQIKSIDENVATWSQLEIRKGILAKC